MDKRDYLPSLSLMRSCMGDKNADAELPIFNKKNLPTKFNWNTPIGLLPSSEIPESKKID